MVIISSMQRKSKRIVKVKKEPTQSPRKRTKKTTNGLRKRRKTLHINIYDDYEDETEKGCGDIFKVLAALNTRRHEAPLNGREVEERAVPGNWKPLPRGI